MHTIKREQSSGESPAPATVLVGELLWAVLKLFWILFITVGYYIFIVVPELFFRTIQYAALQAIHWLYTGEFWKDDTKDKEIR